MLIESIENVAEMQLCTGCGGCVFAEPMRYEMKDTLQYGKRPFLRENAMKSNGAALKVCPSIELSRPKNLEINGECNKELYDEWGPIHGVWVGYAKDKNIRLSGSSGGVSTALSLYCLEKEEVGGVLHTAARQDIPLLNETVISKSREQLLSRTGSRYSPSSPVEKLSYIEEADSRSVFIGKPCDVAAVQMARQGSKKLDDKICLTIAFFCAGVPSIEGNVELLRKNGITSKSLQSLRFRGNGWPGLWSANFKDKEGRALTKQLTYAESWGFLQKYRQWRCYICPDHSGEFSDISVGDPWYRDIHKGDAGRSLIIARTKRGFEVIQAAAKAGYITLEVKDETLLARSQPNLIMTNGAVWGRLMAMKLFRVRTPKYSGFFLFKRWGTNLSLRQKIQSFAGTFKRIFTKKLRKRVRLKNYVSDERRKID